MKHIYLIRHAKSSWEDSSQTDFERTLNSRGEQDAPMMANRLLEKNITPNLIISSPAQRAYSTALIFAEIMNYEKSNIITDQRIYDATTRDLTEVVREVSDVYQTVFLFGHNPAITNFTNLISDKYIDSMPTCAISGIEMHIESWAKIERHCGKLTLFEYPKKAVANEKLRIEN